MKGRLWSWLIVAVGQQERKESWSEENPDGRWRYEYDELMKRDKLSLVLFWSKDKSLTDIDSLLQPVIYLTI